VADGGAPSQVWSDGRQAHVARPHMSGKCDRYMEPHIPGAGMANKIVSGPIPDIAVEPAPGKRGEILQLGPDKPRPIRPVWAGPVLVGSALAGRRLHCSAVMIIFVSHRFPNDRLQEKYIRCAQEGVGPSR